MDKSRFFSSLRSDRTIFGSSLSQPQVTGTEVLVDTAASLGVSVHHLANMLAQVYHETGSYMYPIKETVYGSHADKNPSDATVIQRLDRAWANGQLSWVKTPYWRDGWFGRGQIQITHKVNYEKVGKRIGVDLVGNRDLALNPNVSAMIVVVAMMEGLFTGKKLPDYNFPSALDNPVSTNPRRIVNGQDGTDATIAKYHRAFYDALVGAGYDQAPVQPAPQPEPVAPSPTPRPRSRIIADIRALLDELEAIGD